MKKILLTFISFVLILNMNAQTSIAKADTLTNEKIIRLTKLGLASSIIVNKIKSSVSIFDVSTNSLIDLSNNKVSADVINEMMENVNKEEIVNTKIINSNNPAAMHHGGIYYFSSLDTATSLKKVDALPCNYQTSSGGYGGFGGSSTMALVSGEASKLKIADIKPTFYFYFNAITHADWFSANSPNEFALVKFITKRGKRSFKIGGGSSNTFGSSSNSGIPEKLKIPFEYAEIAPGIYKVTFKDILEKGQYCFVFETNTHKVFDFDIQSN